MTRIVLVEDETELREELAEFLVLRGFEVEAVAGIADALRALRDNQAPAIVLSDLRLQGESGLELARMLRSDRVLAAVARTIILMTGHTDLTENAELELERLAVPMLFKPVSLPKLLHLLQDQPLSRLSAAA